MKKIVFLSILLCFLSSCNNATPSSSKVRGTLPQLDVESNKITDQKVNIDRDEITMKFMESYRKSYKNMTDISDIYTSIQKHSKYYDVDPMVLSCLIIKESNVFERAQSQKNCRGLCQISKYALEDFNNKHLYQKYGGSVKRYTWDDMFNYDKNIEVACWYLRHLDKDFQSIQSGVDVLIAYNVGYRHINQHKNDAAYTYHKDIISMAITLNKQFL